MSVDLNGGANYELNSAGWISSGTSWTIVGWMSWQTITSFDCVFNLARTSTTVRHRLRTNGSSDIVVGQEGTSDSSSIHTPSTSNWYFYMMNYTAESGGGGNGVLRGAYAADSLTNPTTFTAAQQVTGLSDTVIDELIIGADDLFGTSPADALYAFIKVYESALSDADALLDYHYRNAQSASPKAVYKFESGALTTDSSGNGHTLSLQAGSPAYTASEPSAITGDDPSAASSLHPRNYPTGFDRGVLRGMI